MKKKLNLALLLLLLFGILTACDNVPVVDVNVLPNAGVEVLDLKIREGNLTQFAGDYAITSVTLANMEVVLDRYEKYFCVVVTPSIPSARDNGQVFSAFAVILLAADGTWIANVEDTTAISTEWERIKCVE